MLEKYLAEKNISIQEIKKLFPDLAELIQNYQDISGAEGFADEVDKIGREVVSILKERENQIETFVQARPAFSEVTETVTETTGETEPSSETSVFGTDFHIEIDDEHKSDEPKEQDIEIHIGEELSSPKIEIYGYKFTDVDFKQDMFLKILSALGMDFHPKSASWNEGKFYWMFDDKNYFITYGMPFDRKTDVWAIGDDKMSDIIKSKVNYKNIEEITSAPSADGLSDAITVEAKEPITGMTFRQVNESVDELFKIDTMPKLMTLLELSIRKFGCGCGSI